MVFQVQTYTHPTIIFNKRILNNVNDCHLFIIILGVDVISCGIMDDVFAVKGENIDQDKLLEKIKKVLKSVEIIDHTKYPPDYFFYDF